MPLLLFNVCGDLSSELDNIANDPKKVRFIGNVWTKYQQILPLQRTPEKTGYFLLNLFIGGKKYSRNGHRTFISISKSRF